MICVYISEHTHTSFTYLPSNPRLSVAGRKKKTKKGGMSSVLMLFFIKMAALAAVALKLLTLISFKALLLAKIALTISGVIALKKLFDQKQTSTYEVIAHPHYEEFGQHDRSFGRDTAYRGQQDAWTHAGRG